MAIACGPCRSMIPTVEQLAAKGYPVRRMNVDQYPDLAQRFRITNIPCFVMIVNGQEAGRVVGADKPRPLGTTLQPGPRPAPNPNSMLAMPAARGTRRRTRSGHPVPGSGSRRSECARRPGRLCTRTPQQQPVSDAAMLAASVRLRVEDPQGQSCGSGTIIDARAGGEALVLTCGHLFRDSKGKGKIEVDVYGPSPAVRVPGRLIAYDLERDVGLGRLPAAGPRDGRPRGAAGLCRFARAMPWRAPAAITATIPPSSTAGSTSSIASAIPSNCAAAFAAGTARTPWNVEVAGQPVVGRSGGGLFSADGMVIGVCNAAEPEDQEGLFAALASIHAVLDQQESRFALQATDRAAGDGASRGKRAIDPGRGRSVLRRSRGRSAGRIPSQGMPVEPTCSRSPR